MSVELKVPQIGESVNESMIGEWFKSEGDYVDKDESLVEIESDKATLELPAPSAGVIKKIIKKQGDMVTTDDVIAEIDDSASRPEGQSDADDAKSDAKETESKADKEDKEDKADKGGNGKGSSEKRVMPAADRLASESGVDTSKVKGSGPGGRVLKEDVVNYSPSSDADSEDTSAREEKVPMSPLRRRIAQRLVEAQQTAALLTTFNEVDMTNVMALRKQYQDAFVKKYDTKIGFMSFFTKALIDALKQFPSLNAEVSGNEIIYKNHYDIGIAIGGGKGLVVPIIRNADQLSFAGIELKILDFAERSKKNQLDLKELEGGTFTISNGGVYGSMLSTPIVNPPQSGILGLHSIQKRAVVVNDEIVIRPMMNLALTYDHRIVDGREAVTFLVRIKDAIEDPARMLIEV